MLLARSPVILVKLGGSVLTRKQVPLSFCAVRARRLARELAPFAQRLILLHGTGSYGKPPAKRFNYLSGRLPRSKKNVVARVKGDLQELHWRTLRALIQGGLCPASVSSGCVFQSSGGRIVRVWPGPIVQARRSGLVPVLSGDIFPDPRFGFSVCSSDEMTAALAPALDARAAVFVTDVDRVKVRLKNTAEDVTDGMRGKLHWMHAAQRKGVGCELVNGKRRGALRRCLEQLLREGP